MSDLNGMIWKGHEICRQYVYIYGRKNASWNTEQRDNKKKYAQSNTNDLNIHFKRNGEYCAYWIHMKIYLYNKHEKKLK